MKKEAMTYKGSKEKYMTEFGESKWKGEIM